MQPLDPQVHYGITDRDFLDVHDVQMDLLPDKLHQLRWKLNQKAKNEPKFRFYALYDRVFQMDVLEAAWKHVGKKGKASGIDGVKAEDILAEENGVDKFLSILHEELKTKSYRPSPVKRVYIPTTGFRSRHLCHDAARGTTSLWKSAGGGLCAIAEMAQRGETPVMSGHRQ